ncbi:hypothetical protein GCWU000325_00353 [Alloprevotella tannerae ATCC 51259]|uniref:Uncharacterized protein n=1 Tax=Alloprevotella tannerae ATCC 51259 TaxID=626522 RepID=C9LDT1_9BACT|nr:hypothetical protein GCWU000325_00353 [Alloprevotella tannerae ATCC 51259]
MNYQCLTFEGVHVIFNGFKYDRHSFFVRYSRLRPHFSGSKVGAALIGIGQGLAHSTFMFTFADDKRTRDGNQS